MKYDTILFDLDGTLTDSGEGILNSVTYALEKMEMEVPKQSELFPFIGPPLKESFIKKFELTEKDADKAVQYYREYFREKGLFENVVYEGVQELLETLRDKGCQLYVATSKPEEFARKILDYFDLSGYFKEIYGASMDSSRTKKADVIHYALENGMIERKRALMIGDREHDILGAEENGLPGLGVLYGYGDAEELMKAGTIYLAKTPLKIYEWLSQAE
ncbi:HAD family hydrolase [Enterococcus sp. BWB1-3]|uniref:HAD family hydrolase n=1 Tax=unclassified Enterococcus TaxID=2608891 RepID=UPI0019232C02|nr:MULTISPECIES: HAD family hydrolase [unclassified Enterococcus]MBL1228891.1 HAD family hydrolase [Enterococcus sp. BWB1-3]MCB5951566.1 HAD family hydrolase [Enterococcus sp. BWT-B8]MCB5954658.1 HAD family hydrolase [Enterococcus sp. CWB-B31]